MIAVALVAVTLGSCLPVVDGPELSLAGQQVRLTLLHTSDIHSRLLPYDFNPLKTDTDLGLIPEAAPFGGVVRVGAILRRERARAARVLHLDSGDSFQGAPVFNLAAGEVEYRFLSLIGLDAAAIGNHEFDSGQFNFVKQAKEFARFPVLAANYQWEPVSNPGNNQPELFAQPYTIRNVQGLRVGIIGLGNIGSLNSLVEQPNSLQAIPLEQNEAVRTYVELLRPSVDLIVVTSHAGLTEDQDTVEGYEAFYEWRVAQRFVERSKAPWKLLEWFGPEKQPLSVVRVFIPGVEGIDVILGGHLHVVLNPPQLLTDPAGRKVILSHGGAFAKYVNRIDLVVQVQQDPSAERAEVLSHEFKVFPVDAVWCDDATRDLYKSQFWEVGQFAREPRVRDAIARCATQEDVPTTDLLQPYILALDQKFALTSLFAYAPKDIARRNNSTGGDSPLGNIAADSMRQRRGVEAEIALTNSLGIRDNLYAGPLTQESMFNVFPFENTINVMFLSGRELQELMDFVAERSATRGCVSQAQVSGVRFEMDCAQAQLNALRLPCAKGGDAHECPQDNREGRASWECLEDATTGGGRCWAHPANDLTVNGQTIDPNGTYRVAVNDYIARGGSGFLVLKRNTTRVETGIPLRDSLIGYMQNLCSCRDVLANQQDQYGNIVKPGTKQACGGRDPNTLTHFVVDPSEVSFCSLSADFERALNEKVNGCSCADAFRKEPGCGEGTALTDRQQACLSALPDGPTLGRCACKAALAGEAVCGFVTQAARNFCENPTRFPVATGVEDGRISRRVK